MQNEEVTRFRTAREEVLADLEVVLRIDEVRRRQRTDKLNLSVQASARLQHLQLLAVNKLAESVGRDTSAPRGADYENERP